MKSATINKFKQIRRLAMFTPSLLAVLLMVGVPIVRAATIQEQINQLNSENAQTKEVVGQLEREAASYEDTINNLQNQIWALQRQIDDNYAKSAKLEDEIIAAQAELEKQKKLLGDSIKAMYLEGDISTIEMLATSNDLSDFFDKQEYRDVVKSKIKSTLDKVTALKAELKDKKAEVELIIKEQERLRAETNAQKAEQDRLLGYNQAQQNEHNSKVKANQARIAELRRQQAIENARLFGSSPGSGANCGGGYPGTASGQWGNWGCDYPLDYNIDNWGMYNRECVSYTAFKVAASGRYMPYWGGYGNANQWDDNAMNSGIPVDGNPQPGDVAVSNAGTYGHVMYVETVSDDNGIYISDYNQQWDGRYREYWIPASTWQARGLVFIHFQ